jgi:hypothetical protein
VNAEGVEVNADANPRRDRVREFLMNFMMVDVGWSIS